MTRLVSVIAATVLITATASAHHSPAAFDLNSQITIQGRISRLDWTNPHVYIYVDGTSVDGTPAQWMIETDPVPILTRSGWRRELLGVGSLVTVRANPDRNVQRNHAILVSIALSNWRRVDAASRRNHERGSGDQRRWRLERHSRIRSAAHHRVQTDRKGPRRDKGLHRSLEPGEQRAFRMRHPSCRACPT